ncbi:MAG TPA: FAD-binding oxidoreductase [Gammaproteobacteria bacterium]|jgi:FAD/FMN-containing dehydrogenase|nr:FAD-binding oxidoreductase [Chromatiales bacterium]MCP4927118.1 FAD-binding oxidoreductase [Gammaproteobacteria bacterium]MDP7154038.1 FAD-binding oxidoreductase [Gammaproteobacteria bacterium]HJP38902.1 FAD-binding oxidoreductase [Gammaproteobacteria bacterium]
MDNSGSLLQALADILSAAHLLTDDESRTFFSTDVYRQADVLALAVAQPGTVEELQQIVRVCAEHEAPMVVRGGGASYTDGFLPTQPNTILIDSSRLNRIEVNEADMTVTVEPGVTWASLYERLSAQGLRTPFWGPFSGLAATIGGGMSHYAVNYGSGQYGMSVESLTCMDVILANGDLISTGSSGGEGHSSFFRFYGPDLAGLFLGDAGALGIKARFTLRLMKKPQGFAAASFGFPDGESCLNALIETARLGVLAQNFGLDPRQQKTALTEMESKDPLDAALTVLKSSRNPVDGVLQVMKMGLAGRNFLKNAVYSAHFSTEGLTDTEARYKLAAVRDIAARYGAEVANSIPTFFNAAPFMELTPILGPNGELWKPTHGVLPFSRVMQHHADFEALLTEYRDRMTQHRVQLTRMLMTFSTHCFVYEPTFLWEDERSIYHWRVYPASLLGKKPEHPANPEGRALVKEIKGRILELCIKNGASHMQVGKDYPYLETRKPEVRDFVVMLKQTLDPKGLMNPGALGLD